MTKNEFIEAIRSPLKKEGFRKVGQYWYKRNNEMGFVKDFFCK